MSPKKSQKKFSAIPKTEKMPAAKATPVVEVAATPVIPVMAEVTKTPETAPIVETMVNTAEPVSPVAEASATEVATPSRAAALIADLANLDADIARDAAAELGLLKDASAVAPLIAAITNSDGYTHPVVRAAAATSLGLIGDKTAVAALISAINDSMAEASAEAIRALAILGDERAVPALIEAVRNESGFFLPTVRRAAVAALSQLGGALALAELRLIAADSWEDSVIRAEAAEATKNVSSIEGTQA